MISIGLLDFEFIELLKCALNLPIWTSLIVSRDILALELDTVDHLHEY